MCCAEVLPLVEFFLEEDIPDDEALQLLELEPQRKDPKEKQKWKESNSSRMYSINNEEKFCFSRNYAVL